jgi:hypothetical protein
MASAWDGILLGAQLADMKEIDYRNTLAIASLIECLVERGILDRRQLAAKARELDAFAEGVAEGRRATASSDPFPPPAFTRRSHG